jgi:Beta-lactamase
MSKATARPVTGDTLFEVGSVSKTFTATLVACAQSAGHLSLSDHASKYLPALRGSSFDNISLLNLGTHTSGGLPLQVPDDVKDNEQLMRYFGIGSPPTRPGAFERTPIRASMSVSVQKRRLVATTSDLPRQADIVRVCRHVSKVPATDIGCPA